MKEKELKKKLEECEERFRDFTENDLVWIWETDKKGRYTYASAGVEKILGYRPEEIVGKYFYDVFYPKNRESLKRRMFKYFEENMGFHDFVHKNARKDGTIAWLSGNGKPILDKKNMIAGYRGMYFDITNLKQIEEQLWGEKERIDAMFDNIGEGIVVLDKDFGVVMFNPSISYITGVIPEEAVGKKYDEILKFIDRKTRKRADQFIRDAMETGEAKESKDNTVLLISSDSDREMPMAGIAKPLKDKDGNIIGCIVGFQVLGYGSALERTKNEFLTIAAHKLRTPLTPIKLFVEMLMEETVGDLNKVQIEYLTQVKESTERMIKLINHILNISRLELGGLMIVPKKTQLQTFIKDTIEEVQRSFGDKACRIVFKEPKEKLPEIKVDRALFHMILDILFSNAIQYSENGDCKVTVEAKTTNSLYIISVASRSIGIPVAARSKVFAKFFRAQNAMKLNPEGAGLNLYIAKRVMDVSGGKLWFVSEEEGSTIFFVALPLSGMIEQRGTTL